ncbi:MAG: penicillin-binding protein 2 [Anaerolineae bacterium]|uniref:peptidoglycan D,D-transpeptidase FtsI family protein n=1 Tax=Candidatus Flexifilum breve TaxID=3140694 RepID=UPI001ACD2427|nr:penicillin-binding protein 2 [Chloroflexota bacterium]MBN8638920.1 penicillin-binding protein 2 [Anaerolineae bacterium]
MSWIGDQTMSTTSLPQQQDIFRKRLPFVVVGLVLASLVLLGRLASFQLPLDPTVETYLTQLRDSSYGRTLELAAARGNIYDRHGEVLAVNTLEYRVGVSPNLVSNAREDATRIAAILGVPELQVYEALTSDQLWVPFPDLISAEKAARLRELDLNEIDMEAVPRRSYPQGPVGAQLIGFVGGDLIGYFGVEGYYNEQLEGRVQEREVSNIPFEVPSVDVHEDRGSDIILTIDRDVQYIAESELLGAISTSGATAGTILVMNPRNGDILAMANYPTFDPNVYSEAQDPRVWNNPAISQQYEPGSVMKVLTVAAALDDGTIAPDYWYNDQGVLRQAGIEVYNWDRAAHGAIDVTQILVQSLNVGAATIALEMGPTNFYQSLNDFGIGRLTGVDLEGEQSGQLHVPGDENWSESNLLTNSYGQGVAVTPLQMLTAVNAIANGGLMMQPRIVHEIIDGDTRIPSRTANLGRPISAETARLVTNMMVQVVEQGLDERAAVAGYSIAGKTGTAQIPNAIGYDDTASIVTFVGFLPADDPQISVLIRLDRPREYWSSVVAAPVFRSLAERLVILLEIPTDSVRQQLAAQGGAVSEIRR